jgi:hypothetical protein
MNNNLRKPRAIDYDKYRKIFSEIYLNCWKSDGFNQARLRDIFINHQVDCFYSTKVMYDMGILTTVDDGTNRKSPLIAWSARMPDDNMIAEVIERVQLVRYEKGSNLREKRKADRIAARAAQKAKDAIKKQEPMPDSLSEYQAIFEENDLAQDPLTKVSHSDVWCLKFGTEKQYFSAFGFEVMRQIGRILATETVK